jgi:hypothetical protein
MEFSVSLCLHHCYSLRRNLCIICPEDSRTQWEVPWSLPISPLKSCLCCVLILFPCIRWTNSHYFFIYFLVTILDKRNLELLLIDDKSWLGISESRMKGGTMAHLTFLSMCIQCSLYATHTIVGDRESTVNKTMAMSLPQRNLPSIQGKQTKP